MVKVLTIQLQPAELGSIAVRMALNNDTIELHIEAGRPETAGLLQRDRDKLSDILRSAGFQVDGVMVRVVHRDAVTPAGQSAQSFLGGSDQGQAGSSQGDASPFQRHGHEQRQLPQHGNASRNGRDEESRDPSRTGGGIYV
jgi:flagellar hook-length control protein FliK